jgi:SOS-response transcriptional repressor LexA
MSNIIQFPPIERDPKARKPLQSQGHINVFERLDLSEQTIFATVEGDSLEGEGIADGDLLVLDTQLLAERGDIIAVGESDSFTLKIAKYSRQPAIAVVTQVIHTLRRKEKKRAKQ